MVCSMSELPLLYDLTSFPKQYLIPSHVAVVAVNCRIMLAVLRWPVSSATRIFLQDGFGLSHFSLTVFLEFSKEAIPTMLEAANLATKSYCIHICCWTCLYFLWLFFSITLFIYLLTPIYKNKTVLICLPISTIFRSGFGWWVLDKDCMGLSVCFQ